ncbi:MAG TPA: GNAT family N-acetyltransferase [Acidimicrobiia bacterium]|nr:GNAT family N-acetyltransferase [Acidimicrobiia bacterium]
MSSAAVPDVVTRRASPTDFPDVLPLLRRALGWTDADTRYLEWKHTANPFGVSPMWIAVAGTRVVGFRAFLRWEFCGPDGRVHVAARAVDTATDPDYQGRGIFTRLTLGALDELRAEGCEFVFNTPNRQSLPGYSKMGWEQIGRLHAAVRLCRGRSVAVLPTARHPAGRGFVAGGPGDDAPAALTDRDAVARLLRAQPAPRGLSTRRTPDYLAWRYGHPDLGYRALLHGTSPAGGMVLFRLRRRGRAVEATVGDVLVPHGDPGVATALVGDLARSRVADYLIRLQGSRVTRDRFVRLPLVGPVLVGRSLTGAPLPDRSGWASSMGDVELL